MVSAIEFILYEHVAALGVTAIVLLLKFRWKIPVVILKFVGNKNRPTLVLTKARRVGVGWHHAVKRLVVKGYKHHFKDYKAEHYYPSQKGQGALMLWEYKPGWLTPVIPKKVLRNLSEQDRALIEKYLSTFQEHSVVDFTYDVETYKKLIAESIDDVDSEYMLREQVRQDGQYSGGLKDFITKNGPWMALVMIAVILLVGYVIYLDKVPSVSGQCIQAGVEAAKNTYLRDLAMNASTGGVPLG